MWLKSVQMRTPTGSRWAPSNYITRCHRRLESVAVGVRGRVRVAVRIAVAVRVRVAVLVGDKMPVEWEPVPDRGLVPSVTPAEWERSAAMVRGTWGQYVTVSLRLQLACHTQVKPCGVSMYFDKIEHFLIWILEVYSIFWTFIMILTTRVRYSVYLINIYRNYTSTYLSIYYIWLKGHLT